MGNKAKKRSRRGGGGKGGAGSEAPAWDGLDHAMRKQHQQSKSQRKVQQEQAQRSLVQQERRDHRTAKLTHDSKDKREQAKLRLNITKTQREVEQLRHLLQQWDDVTERERLAREAEEARKRNEPPRKRGRLGPESWKLKGAARPAWQVYECDVRYVCPHEKEHEQAQAKARRIQNLTSLFKGSFGIPHLNNNLQQQEEHDLSYPHRRQFLSLLMQLGLLCMEAKQFKSARLAFLECLDLDGVEYPITLARCYLMRLYLQVNRPQSVQTLWESRLQPHATTEQSAWVWYSVALVAYIRWQDFQEGSRAQAEELLAQAMQANVYCAYYLAFSDTFHQHMEYTDEIQDVQDHGTLEEAIEYCCSEQMGMWMGTEGALEWVRQSLLRALHGQAMAGGKQLERAHVDWKAKLHQVEEEYKRDHGQSEQDKQVGDAVQENKNGVEEDNSSNQSSPPADDDTVQTDSDDEENELDQVHIDTLMHAGMFRTVMEMLEADGSLAQVPPALEKEDSKGEAMQETAEKNDSHN